LLSHSSLVTPTQQQRDQLGSVFRREFQQRNGKRFEPVRVLVFRVAGASSGASGWFRPAQALVLQRVRTVVIGFRKAGVVGSNPTIGFCRHVCLAGRHFFRGGAGGGSHICGSLSASRTVGSARVVLLSGAACVARRDARATRSIQSHRVVAAGADLEPPAFTPVRARRVPRPCEAKHTKPRKHAAKKSAKYLFTPLQS